MHFEVICYARIYLANENGLNVKNISDLDRDKELDVYVDGTDEVDYNLN